jgi:hypothetical protein
MLSTTTAIVCAALIMGVSALFGFTLQLNLIRGPVPRLMMMKSFVLSPIIYTICLEFNLWQYSNRLPLGVAPVPRLRSLQEDSRIPRPHDIQQPIIIKQRILLSLLNRMNSSSHTASFVIADAIFKRGCRNDPAISGSKMDTADSLAPSRVGVEKETAPGEGEGD